MAVTKCTSWQLKNPIVFGLLFIAALLLPASGAVLSSDEIIQKIQNRAISLTQSTNGASYEFFKKTTVEQLDGTLAKTGDTKVSLSKVTQQFGVSKSQLISVNGVPSEPSKGTSEDLSKKRTEGRTITEGTRNKNPWLNNKLIQKFVFQVVGEENVAGRKCWVMEFNPKKVDLPKEEMVDRFLKQLRGKIVVDQEEFEVARFELNLVEKVRIWGGLIGSLDNLTVTVHRGRQDDGVWIDASSATQITGRKLITSTSIRIMEETFDIKKAPSKPSDNSKT